MRKNALSRAAVLCCGVSTLVMPAVAFAQAEGGYNNNEIIVTATRQETALQDTPMAIDVVTGEDIQKLNIFDTKEIQNLSPGLELTNAGGRNNTATLRGISFDPDGGTSPAVEVFYNEIGVNANTVFTAIYDLGQVEILRGPQGLFRGKTSPAGALLFGTKRADLNKIEGYAQAAGTTENGLNLQGAVSVPIVQDKVAIRVSGLYDENDVAGVTNVDGRKSSNKTKSARVSLTLQPTENWTTYVMYQYLDAKLQPWIAAFGPGAEIGASGNFSGPALSISDRKSVIEGPLEFTNKTHIATLNSTYDLGGAEIVLNLGYQNSKLSQLRDQDVGNAIPNFERIQDLFTSFETYSSELRLQSSGDSRLHWSVSADYTDSKNYVPLFTDAHAFSPDGDVLNSSLPSLGPLPLVTPWEYNRVAVELDIHSRTLGLAGTLGYDITDTLTLTGGIRYTKGKVLRTQTTLLGGGNPFSGLLDTGIFSDPPEYGNPANYYPLCFVPGILGAYQYGDVGKRPLITKVDGTPGIDGDCALDATGAPIKSRNKLWSGGANLNWEVNPDLTVYASYARTQRAGPPAVAVSAEVGPQYKQAKDETADGFELGFKANLLDRKMNLNVALFYQKFKNFLSYQPALFAIQPDYYGGTVTTLAIPTNGDADTRGVEVQLNYRPTPNLDLGLNASWVKSKYTGEVFCNVFDANGDPVLPAVPSSIGTDVSQTATCTGQPLADSPKFTFNTMAEYRFPTGSVEPFIRGLVNFRPGFTSDISYYKYRDDVKVDMYLGVRGQDRSWEVTVFAKNLLDQARVRNVSGSTYRTQANDGSFIDSGYRTGVVNAPREFGLSAKYNF